MTRGHWKIGAIATLTLSCTWAMGQLSMPVPDPPATALASPPQSCPEMSQAASNSAARCNVLARSSMNDGGNHLLFSSTALAGYDTAFDSRAALGAELEGAQLYVGTLLHRNSSYTRIDNTITGINYNIGTGSMQYLNTP